MVLPRLCRGFAARALALVRDRPLLARRAGGTLAAATAASLTGYAALQSSLAESARFVVGTYTQTLGHVDGKGRGLYTFRVDQETGSMVYESMTPSGENPTYLCRNGDVLYVINETYGGDGTISSYRLSETNDGSIQMDLMNSASALGGGTCYVTTTENRKILAIANYDGGERKTGKSRSSVAVYLLNSDGSIGELTGCRTFSGPGTNAVPSRQGEPHAHMAWLAKKSEGYALFVPDLGLDEIKELSLSHDGKLETASSGVNHPPGSGPRHMLVHPGGKYAYIVDELTSTICMHKYDGEVGKISKHLQRISTLPPGFENSTKQSTIAAIKAHPSGRHIYVSNRVVNADGLISVFQVDENTGNLEAKSYHSTLGITPRDFEFIGAKMLIAANQDSDSLVAFHVDDNTGGLRETGQRAHCSSPVCIVQI